MIELKIEDEFDLITLAHHINANEGFLKGQQEAYGRIDPNIEKEDYYKGEK